MASANEPSVQERAYGEIRRRLLNGDFKLRERLDATAIAADLGMSGTPVREALVRLMAERLIVMRRAKGFYVALWTESQLRALYTWRGMLARLSWIPERGVQEIQVGSASYADRARAVLSPSLEEVNGELARAAANADDRLHRMRHAEAELWDDVDQELDDLVSALGQGGAEARMALDEYHDRRVRAAKDIRACAAIIELPPNGV